MEVSYEVFKIISFDSNKKMIDVEQGVDQFRILLNRKRTTQIMIFLHIYFIKSNIIFVMLIRITRKPNIFSSWHEEQWRQNAKWQDQGWQQERKSSCVWVLYHFAINMYLYFLCVSWVSKFHHKRDIIQINYCNVYAETYESLILHFPVINESRYKILMRFEKQKFKNYYYTPK